jgi:histidinol-phosphate aminotransferase
VYLKRFDHLHGFLRPRIPEPDGVVLRLQRNEKPNNWPKDLQDRIFRSVPESMLQRYPDPTEFYRRLSRFLDVPKESIVVTSGIDGPIKSLISLCCDPGDTIAAVFPGYAMYAVYARMFGVKMAPIEYDPERFMEPAELMEKVPTGTKVLFLPNPSQPVENCFDLHKLEEISALCRKREILFVVDEAYFLFGSPSATPLIDTFDNVLVMRTFSKAFGGASLRLGYVVGSERSLAPLAAFRLAHEASSFSLHAGCILLECFDSHVKPSIDAICHGRDFLRQTCLQSGIKAWGSKSNYVLIDAVTKTQMESLNQALNEQGIYVKTGFPAPLDHHLLVSCGPIDMMKTFSSALCRFLSTQ